jgi:hypothetical protein
MPKIHHIVLLKFKPGGEEKVQPLFAALDRLRSRLPGFLHFAGGPYASAEGLNQGFTHGCLMTFTDAVARDLYLGHPDHEKVKQEFLPFVADVIAFDFADETRT